MKVKHRFTVNVLEKSDEKGLIAEMHIITTLPQKMAIEFLKQQKIDAPDIHKVESLDVTDSFEVSTGKSTKKEAIAHMEEFIKGFSEDLIKKFGPGQLIDNRTGKIFGSESNIFEIGEI